jgi:uroporphyrinogen decarboxylase
MAMSSRERVLTAIDHKEPDRVPIFIGANNSTGIKMKPYRGLKEILGIRSEDRYLYDWPELGTAALDKATLQRLGSDVRGVLDRHPQATYESNRAREPHSPFIDSWGIGQVEIEPEVWFPGIHPLANASTLEDLKNYPGWPDMNDPTRLSYVRQQAKQLYEENQYAIVAAPWLLFPLERAFALQGMDKFLLNLALNPDFAKALLYKINQLCQNLLSNFLRELDENVDVICIGDDLGTQESLLMSPKMYREILKPIHADLISLIKNQTNAKVFFHSDGDIFPLISDFIEIGIDILNPIQTSAGKLSDLGNLKKRFGKDVVFCGAIDTHRILPCGTPDQVRQEVKRVIELLGPGGGFLLAPVHTIMDDVPPENILAMVNACMEFGSYPYS